MYAGCAAEEHEDAAVVGTVPTRCSPTAGVPAMLVALGVSRKGNTLSLADTTFGYRGPGWTEGRK